MPAAFAANRRSVSRKRDFLESSLSLPRPFVTLAMSQKSIVDSDFGLLTRSAVGWVGSSPFANGTVTVIFGVATLATDLTLRALARTQLERLSVLDRVARDYAQAAVPHLRLGRLASVAFLYPHRDWVQRLRAEHIAPTATLDAAHPISSLSYEPVSDRNVLDVTFDGATPLEADYH